MGVLVAQQAPNFTTSAVLANGEIVENYNLHEQIRGKYGVLFFYPLDFTFVCPSELIALDRRVEEFQKRNAEVISVSIDSHFTHNAWRNTEINDGGIGKVNYTMAADLDHSICKAYDVESAGGVAFRGVFVIDDQLNVRSQIVNDLPIGRNIDEVIRIVDAIQFNAEHGEVCPAGWNKGDAGMTASTTGVAEYLTNNSSNL
jgi:peroxiredoxin 2/4